ncbi:MAG: hypothetical protein OJF49_004673 [Ktedonobacterales bacterium]|nr:MAG: hypothetical protein OJF49_004673 [Ktedonobacterales bacterium]
MATHALVGARIRQMRLRKCLSQADLAEMMATSIPSVSRWERGVGLPNHHFRRKLCELFACTPEELGFLDAEANTDTADLMTAPERFGRAGEQTSAGEPERSVATTFPLPHAVPLIGRQDVLVTLKQALLAASNVAIVGLPGIGKTAAALTLLHDAELSAHFADGILWAPLGRTPNLHSLLSNWGMALGLATAELSQCPDLAALERLVVATVGQRRCLFIVDDVWSIEDALRFRVGGQHCAHLITTRMPEIATRFAGPLAVTLREISAEDGVSLVQGLAPDVANAAPEAIRELVTSVGGLPLALTLIARHLSVQAQSGQPRRVRSALERMRRAEERLRLAEPVALVDRHPSLAPDTPLSLQAVIELSDQELDAETRNALYALSVFEPKPNSFGEDAALTVGDIRAEALDTLYDSGLLESCGPGRYTIHQTINDFARLQLESSAPRERMLAFYAVYAMEHVSNFAALDAESHNILPAFQNDARGALPEVFVQGVQAITPYLEARGLYDAAEAMLVKMQPIAAEQRNHAAHAFAWLHQGRIAALRGDFSRAEALYERALSIAREHNERGVLSTTLAYQGEVAINRGAYKQAESSLYEGLEAARSMRNLGLMAVVLRLLGEIADIAGDHEHGAILYQEALGFARQIGDAESISALLQNLGEQQIYRGNDEQAQAYFTEGLAVARRAGHQQRMSALLTNLGTVALRRGQFVKSEELYQQGLQLALVLGNRVRIANALQGLGRLETARKHTEMAEVYLRDSWHMAHAIEHPFLIAESLCLLGDLYLSMGRVDEAEQAFQESVRLVEEMDAPNMGTLAVYGLARVAAERGEIQRALDLGTRAASRLHAEEDERTGEVEQWVAMLQKASAQVNGTRVIKK